MAVLIRAEIVPALFRVLLWDHENLQIEALKTLAAMARNGK